MCEMYNMYKFNLPHFYVAVLKTSGRVILAYNLYTFLWIDQRIVLSQKQLKIVQKNLIGTVSDPVHIEIEIPPDPLL